ncbi:MAG: hypothetical protein ACLR1C_07595 [Agathobacter rectalis]
MRRSGVFKFLEIFYEHFEELGLKELNATYFGEDARFYNYDGKEITITQLKENGDFGAMSVYKY